MEADLVVGCDGRSSVVREPAGLRSRTFGVPMDVLWFRLPRLATDPEGVVGRISRSNLMIMIDRGDYFQIGVVIRKGSIATLRDHGIEMFRQRLRDAAPWLGDRVELLESFDDIRLLNVVLSRLPRGIATDCCVSVTLLMPCHLSVAWESISPSRMRWPPAGYLPSRCEPGRWTRPTSVRCSADAGRRRYSPRLSSGWRIGVVETTIADDEAEPRPTTAPAPLRLMQRFPVLQAIPGYFVGIGLLPEHAPDFARPRAPAQL